MDQNVIQPDIKISEDVSSNIAPSETFNQRDVNFVSLKGFFNIESPTVEDEDSMNYIMETFENMGAKHMSDVLLSLKNIEMKLGVTSLGVGRITAVKNYLKLNNQIAELELQKQSLER